MIDKLREYGIQVRHGSRGDVKVLCPKCSHTRKHRSDPCLSVNIEKGVWNCHNCDFKGAVRETKEYIKPPSELKKVGPKVEEWFLKRGISNQTLLRYRITEGLDYMPQVGGEILTIHFNYFYNGELVNIKYRDSAKNFKMVANARLVPYGVDVLLDNTTDDIVVCEGEVDVLSFYEAGIKCAISVPNGASNRQLEWLHELQHLFDGKRILLATDMDEPGRGLRDELSRRLGRENCWIVDLPKKDANEVLCELGKEALIECIQQAKPYPVDGLEDADTEINSILDLHENGIPDGWYGFDQDLIWYSGQVVTITGIPSHGKSTFLKNLMVHLAMRHGLKFFIYSAEEASTAIALTDLYSIYTGKAFFDSQYGPKITKDEILEIQPFISNHFKFYRLSDQDLSVEGILSKAKEMVRQYGIHGLVIDNMSTVEQGMSAKHETRAHQIQSMLMQISRFAKNHGVIVFLVAHPRKMQELKPGIFRVPNGYDISDTAHWYNLTDYGLSVYRNYETGTTDVHRWKVRLKYAGEVGYDSFVFTPYNSRYAITQKVNDGSNRDQFVGQPTNTKDIEAFARLADSPQRTLGPSKAGRRGS